MKYVLLLIISLNFACASSVPPQQPCGFIQDNEKQRVGWKRMAPVDVVISPEIPSQYHQAIENAVNTWNKAAGRKVLNYKGIGTPFNVTITSPWPYSEEQTARTTITWQSAYILNSYIELNPHYYRVDVESLMVHELGHFLGMAHNDDIDSVMYKYLNSGQIKRDVTLVDITNIRCEY